MGLNDFQQDYLAVDTASFAEDLFVELFQETFGLDNDKGQMELGALVSYFRNFYEQRADAGLQVEVPSAVINRVKEMSDFEIARLMLTMPFEKSERKFFLEHRKDLNQVAFVPALWKRLTQEDKAELIGICDRQIERYYARRLAGK